MTKPVTIPNTFATATTAIPLSNLDADFSTVATALNDANTYSNYAADSGTANAYVVTLTGVSTTYSAGLRIQFKAGAANTGASTLNVNGGGTKNITFQDASALSAGTIAANAIVDVMYDGTQFLLMNDPAGTVGTGDVVGPASATANAIVRFDSTTGKLVKNSVVTIADSTGDMSGVGAFTAAGNVTLGDSTTDTITLTGTVQPGVVISGSSSGDALRITQTGAGNALLVEDSANPDSSPFVVTAAGDVGIGTSSPGYKLDVNGTSNFSGNMNLTAASNINWNGGDVAISNSGTNLIFKTYSGSLAERMRLDSSGNLGLGVTPSAWGTSGSARSIQVQLAALSFRGAGSTDSALTHGAYYNGTNWIYQDTNVGAARYQMTGANGGSTHSWSVAAGGTAGNAITFTQAMSLNASGGLQTLNTIGVGNATPSTSGAGITFPAAQSASSDANTLDDYEEGSWTPAVRGSGTAGTYQLSVAEGQYVKIGKQVTLTCRVTFASSITGGGTGYLQITGGPSFNNATAAYGAVSQSGLDMTTNYTWLTATFISTSGTTILYLDENGDNVFSNDFPISGVSASDSIRFSITYIATA